MQYEETGCKERRIKMEEAQNQNFLTKTFLWMFLGLLGTAIVAWYTYSSGLFLRIIFQGYYSMLLIVEVLVVILFSFLFKKLSPTVVAILYFVYAMINGVSMAVIFALFELSSVILLFVVSALLFGGMALYGYRTQKDLSNWRTLLFGTLLAGLIISLINWFLGNPTIDIIIDWIILLVFFGVTAYDMNMLRMLQQTEEIDKSKLHIYGAMQLYLDFINIFLRVLSIFGKRRN